MLSYDQPGAHLHCPVPVVGVASETIELEEGVSIASSTVAQPIALPQQPSLPDHIPTPLRG